MKRFLCEAHRQKVEIYSLIKKKTRGEISKRDWAKTQYNTATIFTKWNLFLWGVHRIFFAVYVKKKVRFYSYIKKE